MASTAAPLFDWQTPAQLRRGAERFTTAAARAVFFALPGEEREAIGQAAFFITFVEAVFAAEWVEVKLCPALPGHPDAWIRVNEGEAAPLLWIRLPASHDAAPGRILRRAEEAALAQKPFLLLWHQDGSAAKETALPLDVQGCWTGHQDDFDYRS